MIGGFHGVGSESKVGKFAGIGVLTLIEDEAVLIFNIYQLIGVGEDFLALCVQAGDGVAVYHKLGNTAKEVAVEGHAVRVSGVFLGGLCAVWLSHAHGKQHIRGGFGIVTAHQGSGRINPDVPVFFLCKLREQFHIGSANGGQVVILCLGKTGHRKAADDAQGAH